MSGIHIVLYIICEAIIIIGYSLRTVLDKLPTFGPSDLIVIKRANECEVWTNRSFKVGELVLAPETNEIKDRNWSQGHAALVKYDVTWFYELIKGVVCIICHIVIVVERGTTIMYGRLLY